MISIFRSGASAREIFINLVAFIGAAMIAIMTHEIAHGYIALKNGDITAKFAGRLNFNPRSHFDFFGLMMFLVVGIGWAKPVPVNYSNFTNRKKGIFTVAIAGVTANLILAFLAFGFYSLMAAILGSTTVSSIFLSGVIQLLVYFFIYSIFINISLIAFNMLPIFPLDGFRVVQAFAPESRYVSFMDKYGSQILIGIILIGAVIPSLDLIGGYIGWVQNTVISLLSKIWGAFFNIWA